MLWVYGLHQSPASICTETPPAALGVLEEIDAFYVCPV